MAYNRYDGWQTTISRQRRGGLFMTMSYTWSKAIGMNAGNSDNNLRFYVPAEFYRNWYASDFDRTHSWVGAANYELPFGRGKKYLTSGAAAAILGDWQINPLFTFYTGTPFIVGSDGASLNAPGNTQVADQINGSVNRIGGVGPGAPFYDPTAFAAVREVRFGNMGVNALRGPNLFNMNLSLFRTFRMTERFDLQFRAEALNLTNTPALNNPNATVTTPANFMQITQTVAASTAPQRTLRFGLRLAF
jgi:hypothetical protein